MPKDVETIIVGAGPAGTSCAWQLRQAGRDVLILDKEQFPRTKLCAGWITDGVFEHLQFKPQHYPLSIIKLKFKFHYRSWPFSIQLPFAYSYSIRRYEFDNWLLERSGADFERHQVKEIEKAFDGSYVLDGGYRCRHLVGAGGTTCPVRSQMFEPYPNKADLIVTLEKELEYPQRDDFCHVFLFKNGLRGYSWYVPKGNGWVNIGLGGVRDYFRREGCNIHHHFKSFVQDLVRADLLDAKTAEELHETGHPYHFYPLQRVQDLKRDRCYLIGDSAGFATRDLGEGIAPAIESGLMAAREILGTGKYDHERIARTSIAFGPAQRFLINHIHT
jgi:geranylgeranyl reductase family protein